MRQIKVIDKNNYEFGRNPELINDMFKLRSEVFKGRLGWDVESDKGLEKDFFDNQQPSYIAMLNESDDIVGGWRAIPTTKSYMLKDIFPELLRGELAPEEKNIWEISRFAISKNRTGKSARVASEDTAALVSSFYSFAIKNGITDYVLVTTTACERILRYLGVNMRRMGDGQAMQIGVEKSVALWVKVDNNLNINPIH
ncbi:acyl-homoserine-lactone synthase [Paraglaciecola mesophila KMM 241]|jgi:acyl homoserine lactone synthase|uniref:Acyl-homoserine-lactone synthase n=1 Tax=Paraglaciecola mesophila KMM 241 TaxID=1128912 RepID=K6Y120_9ALTE|nr:acyl-homoserine-lactone synthase [Paraglaciecola mesophila]GAC26539.1 acyl-homoserine-lactone synthase [Paraglaciecola mesophila KMM 241]